MDQWLSGMALYGDNFSPAEIREWFESEREAYADLGAGVRETYRYGYHAINRLLGFNFLPSRRYSLAVGLGSAYAHEFMPILPSVERVIVVDSSAVLRGAPSSRPPIEYRPAQPNGDLPLADAAADLISCLGVLHHVANVSHVIREMARCLSPGGFALIREPIVSMGDWRHPRPGLTARERGIPLAILRDRVQAAGLSIERESLCFFPLTSRLGRLLSGVPYDLDFVVRLDNLLSKVFAWNLRYHATRPWHKLRPTCVFLVIRK
jgi:SAM-dependent methyltransferase